MTEAATAPVDNHPRTYSSAAERFAEQRRLVAMVAATYKACREAPVVAAYNLDPTPGSGSIKWTLQTAEYIADVELGVRKSLELRSDRETLHDAWNRFVEDDTTIDVVQRRMIQILARSFYRRELHPGIYFRPNKHPQRRDKR